MASPQPALRKSPEPHIHIVGDRCPVCDQPIPNEKADEVRDRMEARERDLTEAANLRAAQQFAREKAQIEAAAKAEAEKLRAEKEEALKKAAAEIAAKVEAARAEGQKTAAEALQEKIAAAEKAKADAQAEAAAASACQAALQEKITAVDAEKRQALAQLQALRAEQDALVNERVQQAREALEKDKAEALAALEQRVKARDADWQEKVAAVERDKQEANKQFEALKVNQEQVVSERVQEVREAMENAKAEALGAERAKHFEETQRLTGKLEALTRQLERKTAEELGEGAEINLFEALKAEFEGDRVERVGKGVSGADIIDTVIHNGRECGRIIYDSKNSTAWRDDYVRKLVQDQTAAGADHAILSTFKFPHGAQQVAVRDGVIIVNPARAVVIAQIIRRELVLVHTLRLSKSERARKMAALFDFITSQRCRHLLERTESHADEALKLQEKEIKAHQAHWKQEGLLFKSIQRVKAQLEIEIDAIIGTDEPA